VKVLSAETVAASSPQKHKPLPAELVEERRKERDDQRVQLRQMQEQSRNAVPNRFCKSKDAKRSVINETPSEISSSNRTASFYVFLILPLTM
jgi:hypothetical protein